MDIAFILMVLDIERLGYYFYSKVNTPRARLDVVFTFMPGRDPLLQRWLVVGRPGVTWNTLVVAGVALDSKHCYVLLEPDPDLAVHRINGRLRLDLYLAQYEKREVYLFSLYTAAPDIPQSTAHRKIAEMEKRGLVTREIPRPDGRRVAISMTAQGLAIVDRLLDRIIELWEGGKS